jgi:hypothetical protein
MDNNPSNQGVDVPACRRFSQPRRVFAEILFASNDTRATPKANCMVQSPALEGASPWAWFTGFRVGGATAYLQVTILIMCWLITISYWSILLMLW